MCKIRFSIISVFIYQFCFGQIGMGTTNPHPSSILDVESTTKGFLPPRMTTNQRNMINQGLFEEGLTIYNETENCINVWNNSDWISLCGGDNNQSSSSISSQGYFLKADNPSLSGAFGQSIAISDDGNVIAIGSYLESDNSGAVYIFD